VLIRGFGHDLVSLDEQVAAGEVDRRGFARVFADVFFLQYVLAWLPGLRVAGDLFDFVEHVRAVREGWFFFAVGFADDGCLLGGGAR